MRLRRSPSARALEAEIPRLRRFARALTRGDAAEADDLVQETLLKALGGLDRFRGGSALGTWLTSIMLNVHKSGHRKATRRRAHLDRLDREEPSEPARQAQRLEVAETLDALNALPEEQRTAIALVAVGDKTYAEAAEALGVRMGTLMSRISRGRAAMRARLEGDVTTDDKEDVRWRRTSTTA